METEYVSIYEREFLDKALERKYGNKNIPSHVILDKTLTGIGATHTELHSHRNSIIIEPNVPVIINKANGHSDWLTVYSETTQSQIKKYLSNDRIKYKKILTTPEGFKKIRKAANKGYKQIQSDYFCLFDECEKITQDCDYRAAITQPVYDFFEFKNKAFVSATPLEVRHPKFKEQGFKKIKIKPEFDYRKDLHLIVTNSYEKTVREELERLKDSPCVCIFLNSVTEINKLVNTLKLMDESYIFCSEEGVKKLKEAGFTNALSEIYHPLKKYNFFTSMFYSALDINLGVKPDIMLLTNLNTASYTMIDPMTEAIQIQGRFRTKFEDGQTYSSLTHITNKKCLDAKSEEDVTKIIDEYVTTYKHLLMRFKIATDSVRKKGIKDQLKKICEDYLLDENGNIDYFGIDNKYNEERVKKYYEPIEVQEGEEIEEYEQELCHAYEMTGFFNIEYEERYDTLSEDDIFRLKYESNAEKQVYKLIRILISLNSSKDLSQIEKEQITEELKKTFDLAELTIEAYKELDFFRLDMAASPCLDSNYKNSKSKIRRHLTFAIRDNRNERKRFSAPVLQEMDTAFSQYIGQKIAKEETKRIIGEIYQKYGIFYNQPETVTAKLTQNTIAEYYEVKPHNKEKPNKWSIKKMLPKLAEHIGKE